MNSWPWETRNNQLQTVLQQWVTLERANLQIRSSGPTNSPGGNLLTQPSMKSSSCSSYPRNALKMLYEAFLLFQLAEMACIRQQNLCRKMKSQTSVIICVVYYLRKIRVLLEMSISTKSRITNVFEQTKTTVYLNEDLDNHCFIIYFFRRHYKSDSPHCMPSYTTTVTRYAKHNFPAKIIAEREEHTKFSTNN